MRIFIGGSLSHCYFSFDYSLYKCYILETSSTPSTVSVFCSFYRFMLGSTTSGRMSRSTEHSTMRSGFPENGMTNFEISKCRDIGRGLLIGQCPNGGHWGFVEKFL